MPPVHPGMRFDYSQLGAGLGDAHALLLTDLFVGHLTTAEADRDFDLVTFFKESAGMLQLNVAFEYVRTTKGIVFEVGISEFELEFEFQIAFEDLGS